MTWHASGIGSAFEKDHMKACAKIRFSAIELLLFVLVIIWGLNFVAMKWALKEMLPLAFSAVRYSLATLFFLAILLACEGWQPVAKKDALKLLGLGLLGNTFFQVPMILGLDLTTSGNSALLLATIPVWAALIAVALRIESLTKWIWSGIGLSLIGVALVTLGSGQKFALNNPGGATLIILGNLLMLLAAASWAGYTVFSKDLLKRYSPLRLSALAMLPGALGLWLFAIPEARAQDWTYISWQVWLIILFSAVLALVVGYIIWATAVRQIGAARTAAFNNLVPVVTFIGAYFALGEPISWLQGLGGVMVLIGVRLTMRNNQRTNSHA